MGGQHRSRSSICCNCRRGTAAPNKDVTRDDHHSPLDPDDYIRWRVKLVGEFYQHRIPKYHQNNNIIECVLLVGAVVSAGMASFDLATWCAFVSAILALVMSWRSF